MPSWSKVYKGVLQLRSFGFVFIAKVEVEINPVERKILSDADKKLIANARLIYQEISRFINLADYRQKHHISSKQWWWYLDVLANLSHCLEPAIA